MICRRLSENDIKHAAEGNPTPVADPFHRALSLRVAAAVVVDQYLEGQGRRFLIEGDATVTGSLVSNLPLNNRTPSIAPGRYVLRTPGFPLLLSIPIRVLGDRVLPATILLAGVGTGCLC